MTLRHRTERGGQATLSFVLLVGGIIIEIAIAGLFVTHLLSTSGAGERFSARALSAAHTGVRDAQLRIVRNKEFFPASPYSFAIGSDSVTVEISRTIDVPTGTYIYTITSTGSAFTRKKKLVARMTVNMATGLAQLQSLTEQTL